MTKTANLNGQPKVRVVNPWGRSQAEAPVTSQSDPSIIYKKIINGSV